MKRALLVLLMVWAPLAATAKETNNLVLKSCIDINRADADFQSIDFTQASNCYQNWKANKNAEELAELRDFLKHNPRYRFPGQSLNKCWGKPREMPFESSGIAVNGNGGYNAWVNYKDTIPAGCYETAPWDNRESK